MRFVGADLGSDTLGEALADVDLAGPTLWLWEAVAPYLPPEDVRRTLEAVAALSAPRSRLVMTFVHDELVGPRVLRPAAGTLASIGFRVLGEPILSTFDPWALASVLSDAGFATPQVTTASRWASDAGLSRRPDPLDAEQLAVAERI